MEETDAKMMMERLLQMPFPVDDWKMLAGLADECGTQDVAFLMTVCFLYGVQKSRDERA